jgi:lipopolysaccharide transport system permease protein
MHGPMSASPSPIERAADVARATPAVVESPTAGAVVEIRPSRGWFDLELNVLWKYRELLRILIERDVKVRYRQAALGAAWAIIQPLFAVVIFTIVFGHFAKMPSNGVPYPLFAFAATLPWTYFSEATRRGSVGLVTDAELVRKIYFPRLIIPLSAVCGPLVDFACAFVVMLGALVYYGIAPGWHLLFIPVFLFVAMLLALSVALWLGPVNVRFRDVTHTLPFMLQVWMYGTPIVYPLSMVPQKWQALYSMNPMVGVIEGFRWAILGKTPPAPMPILISVSVIVVALVGGLVIFKRRERQFADLI